MNDPANCPGRDPATGQSLAGYKAQMRTLRRFFAPKFRKEQSLSTDARPVQANAANEGEEAKGEQGSDKVNEYIHGGRRS